MKKSTSSIAESTGDFQQTLLQLSADIGSMADRIGAMADRIGDMSDRILETQRIQGENLKSFQDNSLEMTRILSDQLTVNQELISRVLDKLSA